MSFDSLQFGLFFFVVYSLYLLLRHRQQNMLLLAASYFFYGCLNWKFLALLLFSTIIDYICGLKIHAAKDLYRKRLFLLCSIFCNLTVLGFFKYFNFFITNVQNALHFLGLPIRHIDLHIILPVGISFYTFKTLSYTIDIYRAEMSPTRNFLDYALFVSFFPQILSGPIDRAKDFLTQICSQRTVTLNKFYTGCYLFFWGFFEKVFIADNLARPIDEFFNSSQPYPGFNVLIFAYALAVQIFCDFDGYSNMARGIGMALGFDIMINFNMPYISPNLAEFWRRWHVSLSSWFRDYVYTPMVISRRHWGIWGTLFSLFVCFLLIGLWHGAEWKFIVFGILQGIVLSYEVITKRIRRKIFQKIPARIITAVGILFTFSFFSLCCVLFRAQDGVQAGRMYRDLFCNFSIGFQSFQYLQQIVLFSLPMVLVQFLQFKKNDLLAVMQLPFWGRGIIYFIMYYLIVVYGVEGGKEFIYFKF